MLEHTITAFAGTLLIVGLVAAGGSASGAAGSAPAAVPIGAAGSAPAAVPIGTASVTQKGAQVAWRVVSGAPFTPSSLAAERQSLCLVVDRASPVVAVGELCVGRFGRHSHVKLVYRHIAPSGVIGPARPVAATVTRQNAAELTASFLPASIGLPYRPLRWQVISVLAASGCSPAVTGCSYVLPARPALARLHTPRLAGCVAAGPSLVYGGSPTVHDIALTFDDGPWYEPPTMDFVTLLAREHVPATFFEIGRQIGGYDPTGSVQRAMLADGDMIGDHTWNHPDMAALSPAQQRSELELTVEAIRHATGFTPCLWRPPYGDTSPELDALARALGLLTVKWDIDPRDWALPGVHAIIDHVTTNARNGGIVEEHFGGGPRYQTLDALPREIARLRARGYKFVTVADLLGLRLIYR